MLSNSNKRTYAIGVVLICFSVFYFWLASRVPYTHDDWEWGAPSGIQQMLNATVNSRYVGNSFEIIMTRSEFVKTLIMGGGYFILPCLIVKISGKRDRLPFQTESLICFLLCNVLMLSMDRKIWQQTYGWIAGYANFAISAIFMIVNLETGLRAFDNENEEKKLPFWKYGFYFLMGFCGQLFLENIAVFMVLFLFTMLAVGFARTRKLLKPVLALFLGAAAGLIVLFSSNLYETLWTTGEAIYGYRQLSIHASATIDSVLEQCWIQGRKIPYKLLENNMLISISLLVIMCGLLLKNRTKTKTALSVLHILLIGYIVSNHCFHIVEGEVPLFLINISFLIVITVDIFLLYRKKRQDMMKYLTIWLSVPAVIVPLIVTSEQGPRLFFTSNVLLILFAATQLRELMHMVTASGKKKILLGVTVLSVVLILGIGNVYYDIGNCKNQRQILMEQAIETGADTLWLPAYPHRDYLWYPDPIDEGRLKYFRLFFGLPETISVEIG